MTTTKRYLQSTKNLPAIMAKIVSGAPPERFTVEHLIGLGFGSSNDRSVVGMLKDLGFLTEDGIPTDRYHEYRDSSRSKVVMGNAIRDAYPDIFYVSENPSLSDREAIRGKFKTMHGVSDPVADKMVATFLAFLDLANLSSVPERDKTTEKSSPVTSSNGTEPSSEAQPPSTPSSIPESRSLVRLTAGDQTSGTSLHYNIEIHLPATRDIEVFNAIFKSLRENILGRERLPKCHP